MRKFSLQGTINLPEAHYANLDETRNQIPKFQNIIVGLFINLHTIIYYKTLKQIGISLYTALIISSGQWFKCRKVSHGLTRNLKKVFQFQFLMF